MDPISRCSTTLVSFYESARRRASLDASPQKSVGVHGHTSELCDKVLADRYDTSSSLSVKRVPTRT